jgi:hypothetical protein
VGPASKGQQWQYTIKTMYFGVENNLAPPRVLEWSRSRRSWSHAKQALSVESKTSGISSLNAWWQDLEARYKSSNEVNMTPTSPGTKPEKIKNSEDPVRKLPNLARQGASSNPKRNWWQGPTCRSGKTQEPTSGKWGRWLGRSGPRPTGPAHFHAQSAPLWPSRHSGYL